MLLKTDVLQECLDEDLETFPTREGEIDSPQDYAAWLLRRNFLKKLVLDSTTDDANEAAVKKFTIVNERCRKWAPEVDGFGVAVLEKLRANLARDYYDTEGFPKFQIGHVANYGMPGPGASILADGDDLTTKLFFSPLSATSPTLYRLYKSAIGWNQNWEDAEVIRFESFSGEDDFTCPGNKMFFVPKDAAISRPACTEPTLNMFFQKGLGDCIEKYLLPLHGINFEDQQRKNRWFAHAGSMNGRYATIDLSSASDTIGWNFCKLVLPPELVKMLSLLRAPQTTVDLPGKGKRRIDLHMVSTMGNGFTFPLQTWIFANLTKAVYDLMGYPVKDPIYKLGRQYSVFGDDIICLSEAYPVMVRALNAAGFTVNLDKSFSSGGFRESCGGDFFKGRSVRPVYFKECTSASHVYSVINRLSNWSIRHKIALPLTIEYLLKLVPFRPVPLYEGIDSGIRTPVIALTSRKTDDYGNYVYHKLEMCENTHIYPGSACDENTYAMLVGFLHGSVSCRTVTSTLDKRKYLRYTTERRSYVPTYRVSKHSSVISWNFVEEPDITVREIELAYMKNILPAMIRRSSRRLNPSRDGTPLNKA